MVETDCRQAADDIAPRRLAGQTHAPTGRINMLLSAYL